MKPAAGGAHPPITHALACSEEAIATIDELARTAAQQLHLAPSVRTRLRLVVEELLTNVLMHGDPPADGIVRLALSRPDETTLMLQWADPGRPFDPRNDLPADSRDAELEDRRVGGLGWPLILGYCRIQAYSRSDDQNRLTLVMAL